jgi:predicted nucleic acid-binding OB-fold protein
MTKANYILLHLYIAALFELMERIYQNTPKPRKIGRVELASLSAVAYNNLKSVVRDVLYSNYNQWTNSNMFEAYHRIAQ